ncbi:MAG: hypothetical protein WAT19_04335 [Ferruginibacter sp.]
MPINEKFIENFEEEKFLHVICKASGDSVLFKSDENKSYFLKKFSQYSEGYFDTYAYCLLSNHVHWLIKCKKEQELIDHLSVLDERKLKSHQQNFLEGIVSFEQEVEFLWKDFFISYAMAYNKMYQRKGALFINPFRRIKVENEEHLTQLVVYIHANAVKHGIVTNLELYKDSSYQSILSDKPTQLKRKEVLDWFGGRERFVSIHRANAKFYYNNDYAMEL